MKIGIEAQRLFRQNKHGMDFVAFELLSNLQQIDTVNEYVVFVGSGPDVCLQPTLNFRIRELAGNFYPWWEQYQLRRAAQEEKLDLLHCTSNTGPLYYDGPMVLTLHDIIYLESGGLLHKSKSGYQNAGALYRRWVVPRVIKKCAGIITVSEFEKKRILEQLPSTSGRVQAIYNGIGEIFKRIDHQENQQQTRERYRLPRAYILFLGNTDPKKNVHNTLLGYARYVRENRAPLPLVMVDYPAPLLYKNLDMWGIPEIRPYVITPGYVVRGDLPAVYSMATLFLYPSLRESFGLPILEAMACGTPVITSDRASMPEVARDAAVLINPEKPNEIAQAIERLLEDADLRVQLIASGHQRAAEFSWRTMAGHVQTFYRQSLDRINRTEG